MTSEKVLELAKQAGMEVSGRSAVWLANSGNLQAFAQLVRNEALEEAAVKCEEIDFSYSACEQFISGEAAFECGKQIRSMKK